jgi:hypothetical protein
MHNKKKRLESIGNYVIVTDVLTGVEEFTGDHRSVTYSLTKDNHIRLYIDEVYVEGYFYEELVDFENNMWNTFKSLILWLRFNTAVPLNFSNSNSGGDGSTPSSSSGAFSYIPSLYKNIESETLSLSTDNYNGNTLNMLTPNNYNILLPPISSLEEGYSVTIASNVNDTLTGNIVPYNGELIAGNQEKKVFGRSKISIYKHKDQASGESSWRIYSEQQLGTNLLNGKTKEIEFYNETSVVVNHNLGYVPIIQVWVEDGQGGYTDIDVDIDHEWTNKMSSIVNLSALHSGKILYY